mgnify:CR=1 FL=1
MSGYLRNYMKTCLKTAEKNRMCVRVIGDKTGLDEDIRKRIDELEKATVHNDGTSSSERSPFPSFLKASFPSRRAFLTTTLLSSPFFLMSFTSSLRRSSVNSGNTKRITAPSLVGVIPTSDVKIAFSISLIRLYLSEDEVKTLSDELQKLTDKYIKEIEKMVEDKSKEVLTV